MATLDEIRQERLRKLDILIQAGMDPYTAVTNQTHTLQSVVEEFSEFEENETEVIVNGRVMSLRRHGGAVFVDLFDGTAKLQAFLSKDTVGSRLFTLFTDAIDSGDFIEVKGIPFVTKRGTDALGVSDWRILTKSLKPIPTEHFGIKDEDDRLRKRYLDILLDEETREMFEKKAAFWRATREFMEQHNFHEVNTPTLETTTGGAEANPFVTHHDDFDINLYLRISVGELWQKRLMAAGFPRVYEVGRVYRNEGSSPNHLQEFTNLEFYAAYMNFEEGLTFLEKHIRYVLDQAFDGERVFKMKDFTVDFTKPFERIEYVPTIKEMTGIDVTKATETEMAATAERLGIVFEGNNKERLTDTLWKYCRTKIAGPVWLTGHPKLVSALAKENKEKRGTVLRAQLIMAGAEFNNCYAELNDPVDQENRFKEQAELLKGGDQEAMMPDWEFVEMLEHGMPPTFGAASLGERFFAYLVDKPIRETQYFPLMRPKEPVRNKDKTRRLAVAVVAEDAGLENWQVLNTVAHLGAGFGARCDKDLLKHDMVESSDGVAIPLNIQHAILVKTARREELSTLLKEAKTYDVTISAFTREMLETTNDNKVAKETSEKAYSEIETLGVLVFGEEATVKHITGDYPLYS